MEDSSGVGVIDKASMILDALERGPASLASLVEQTGLARPTAHRLAVALEFHQFVSRNIQGQFILGARFAQLAAAAGDDTLLTKAALVLQRLRDITGESAQLYRRKGDVRICVAASERPSGLRDSIPVGSQLSMSAGSSAQVLLAWQPAEKLVNDLPKCVFSALALSNVRKRGWAQSVAEREAGVASVSAPVRGPDDEVIAAISVSGPIERLTRQPGRLHAPAVMAAADHLTKELRKQHH